ncbi:MAG: TRAP transporter small permease [Synergistaceae bacterium]|nr:TRAP transporter small permease [Synergistaceae bacterium]
MKVIRWLDKHFEETVLIVLMIGISCTMFLQVIMRYVFNMPLTWPEELSRYMLIWTVFFSMSYTIYMRNMLRVDVLAEFLPEKVRQALEICIQFLSLGIYSVFTYYSLIVYRSLVVSGRVSPALRIPMYLVYSALCIGFFLSVVRTIQLIVELIMAMRGKRANT